MKKRPEPFDAFDLTACQSAKWNDIGRALKVSYNDRQQLKNEVSSDNDKLESVLQKWIETESVPVTWSSLIQALEKVELRDVVRAIKEFLMTPEAIKSYSQS